MLTGSRLVHDAEKIIPEAKVSLEIELLSRFPTPVKCERISVSLQCKVRLKRRLRIRLHNNYNLAFICLYIGIKCFSCSRKPNRPR